MFSWTSSLSSWLGLLSLTAIQLILGVDNIVLVTILSGNLPIHSRKRVRKIGVIVAMVSRLALLGVIAELSKLDKPFTTVLGKGISVESLILIFGGMFLIGKATQEMYVDVEQKHETKKPKSGAHSVLLVLVQILFLDVIFSLDQVITAVGLVKEVSVQVIAVVLSVILMFFFVNKLAHYLEKHPSLKIMSLSFLVLIGISLVAEGTGSDVPKGYIYFAMAYSLGVEVINIRRRQILKASAPKP